MVYKIFMSLYLVLSMMKFTDQSQSTDTILTSLKNLVIDNSRTTVTFNSTALRTLIAMSNSAKMPSEYYIILSFSLYIFDFHSLLLTLFPTMSGFPYLSLVVIFHPLRHCDVTDSPPTQNNVSMINIKGDMIQKILCLYSLSL